MPTNNPANDRYNPPNNMSADFEEINFGELNIGELFWQTNRPEETNPWRKVSETTAENLKAQKIYNFNLKTKIFLKI
tara:strand:- start:353 stop:583 length:231 start_codon:yes stop_codon:yes gene_type:complete